MGQEGLDFVVLDDAVDGADVHDVVHAYELLRDIGESIPDVQADVPGRQVFGGWEVHRGDVEAFVLVSRLFT